MSERLTYRLFEERDLPGLLRLWEEAGWGALTEKEWRQWFLETPLGACLVAVALDEKDRVAGQEVFTPSHVEAGERRLRALRVSAPILRMDVRGAPIRRRHHPVISLLMTGREAAAAAGYDLIYGLPEHAWLPVFRWMSRVGLPRFDEAEYECVTLRLCEGTIQDLDRLSAARGLQARPVGGFGAEYESLWRSAKAALPVACGVVRDPRWVSFRNGGRAAFEVREVGGGGLAGYVSFKKQGNLLADLLARRASDLAPVLAAGASLLTRTTRRACIELKAMATPPLRPALEALGFERTDYKFAFVCSPLSDAVPAGAAAPERWYVMPGD